jgi:zinc finger protein
VPGPCPICNTEVEYIYQTENIPYFSDILIISAMCNNCGYRYVDTQVLTESEPSCWEIAVTSLEDLSVRIVRSMAGTIRIPELGVRIDPGVACEGFVSNVEGILCRIEQIIDMVIRSENHEQREAALSLKKKITGVREGVMPITLIIEDPSGNSAIIADKAKKTEYCGESG